MSAIDRGREDNDLQLRVRLHDLTARLQSMDLREVDVEHKHVGLEPLNGLQQRAAVGDAADDIAIQCQ